MKRKIQLSAYSVEPPQQNKNKNKMTSSNEVHNSHWSFNAFAYKYKQKYSYLRYQLWEDLSNARTIWYPFKVCCK